MNAPRMEQSEESDEDIPDLESVDSCEYVEESDDYAEPNDTDPLFIPKTVKSYLKSENCQPVEKWLGDMKESRLANDTFNALRVFVCSPFLYGDHVDSTHWTTKWLHLFQNESLITASNKGNVNALSWDEVRIVDLLEISFDWLWNKINESDIEYVVFVVDSWDVVNREDTYEAAMKVINENRWFKDLLEHIQHLPNSLGFNDGLFTPSSVSLCCTYCCCYIGYEIRKSFMSGTVMSIYEKFQSLYVPQPRDYQSIKIYLIQAEQKYHFTEDFEQIYSRAMNLWPCNVSIHESRAMCHLGMMQQLALVSDLYRILIMVKDHKMALLYITRTFRDLEDKPREELFSDRYRRYYPEDASLMEKHLEGGYDRALFERTATGEESDHYQKLKDLAAKGSDDILQENYEAAQLYLKNCLKLMTSSIGWHVCLPWDSATTFVLGVKFGYAWTLFKMSKYDEALEEFQPLQKANTFYPIAGAHYYAAVCYMKLKRFCEATNTVNEGLYSYENKYRKMEQIVWPGTTTPIHDCNQYLVKTKLLQMKAQLSTDFSNTIAVCPHPLCLQHNITRNISREDSDFKGYINIHCSEKCNVGFHPSCWRRYKVGHPGITSEKGFLSSSCITPDCPGLITYIAVYETGDKPKFEIHSEDNKSASTPQDEDNDKSLGSSSSSYASFIKSSKKKEKGSSQDGGGKKTPTMSSSSTTSTSQPPPATPTLTSTTPVVATTTTTATTTTSTTDATLSRSGSSSSTRDSSHEETKVIEDKSNIKVNSESNVNEKQENQVNSSLMMEDSRKVEDSVSVFNKLAEEDLAEKKSKAKKKKKKKAKAKKEAEETTQVLGGIVSTTSSTTGATNTTGTSDSSIVKSYPMSGSGSTGEWYWDSIFTFGKRSNRFGDNSPSEERRELTGDLDSSSSREQLSSAVRSTSEEHPSSQDSFESPSTLKQLLSSDNDWLLSYFVEVFKINGPLHPMDPRVIESLKLLPEENKKLVDSYGGIGEFLIASSLFELYDGGAKIGLKKDKTIMAETLKTTHGNRSGNRDTPSTKPSTIGSEVARKKEKEKPPKWRAVDISKLGQLRNDPPDTASVPPAIKPSIMQSSSSSTSNSSNNNTSVGIGSKKPPDISGLITRKDSVSSSNGVITKGKVSPTPGKKKEPIVTDIPRPGKSSVITRLKRRPDKTLSKTTSSNQQQVMKQEPTVTKPMFFNEQEERLERLKRENVSGIKKDIWSQSKSGSDWKTGVDKKVAVGTVGSQGGGTAGHRQPSLSVGNSSEESGRGGPLSSDRKLSGIGTELKSQLLKSNTDHYANAVAMVTNDTFTELMMSDLKDKVMINRGVNTDPLPPVENYREKYDSVLKEKKSLEDKLEVSEDRMVRMQKQHGHEMEVIEKKTKADCSKDTEKKVGLMEEKIKEEREKANKEKKEISEQMKVYKAECKAATEKLTRSKKEFQRKEEERNEMMATLRQECEKLKEEKNTFEKMYQSLLEQHQYLIQRAKDAEIAVINTKRESVMKPANMKLQELEKLCSCAVQTVPGGEPELQQYRDQFKSVLDNYQGALDDQVRKIQTGTELSKLEPVVQPTPPSLSPPLRMKIQQVQRNMMLLQRKMLIQQQQQQQQQQQHQLSSSTPSLIPPQEATGISMGGPPLLPLPGSQTHLLDPTQQLNATGVDVGETVGAANNGGQVGVPPSSLPSTTSTIPVPKNTSGSGTATPNQPSPSTAPKKPEGKNTASFDYLVTLLTPQYPTYTRDDFKAIITQLRKSGSLNGLPMDVIVKKVKELIEQKENLLLSQQQQQLHQQQAPPPPPPTHHHHPQTGLPSFSQQQPFSLSQISSLSQMSTLPFPSTSMPIATQLTPQLPLGQMPPPPLSMLAGGNNPLRGGGLGEISQSLSQFPSAMTVSTNPASSFLSQGYFLQQQQDMMQLKQMLPPPKAPPPVFSEVEYNDDNSCIICYEDMLEQNSVRLECGHRFHKSCIRSWLNEQNTCPTCRNHALLPEDFPRLH